MKKRVLTVWDGQRRLAKDDMMLGQDFEVRLRLPPTSPGSGFETTAGNEPYVTDLDVQTLKRAEAFFGASEEERGPWIPTNRILPDSAAAAAAIEAGGSLGYGGAGPNLLGYGQLVA